MTVMLSCTSNINWFTDTFKITLEDLFMYFEKTGFGSGVLKAENPRTDLLFAEIANSGSLGILVPILFLLGLIAAAYSSADSALTSLTTSFSVDFMNIKDKPIESQNKIRRNSHLLMSFLLVVIILILRNYSNDSAIWMLIKLAGFTYGPLIGLFFFGIITSRELIDKLVPIISIVIPVIIAMVWYLHSQEKILFLGTYKFGAELIIYNAALSFLGLLLISKSKS
jgi:Na+/proline symporter